MPDKQIIAPEFRARLGLSFALFLAVMAIGTIGFRIVGGPEY